MAATIRGGDGNMAQKGRGIFMVYVDIDAQDVQEFNEWYNKEHLPELLSVPGILSAARYEAVKGGPQYLACYELDSVAVMQTPAFTNRPRTPWGQKVSPSVIGKSLTRIVGEQIYPDGIEMPERGMAPVLQIGRMSVRAEVDADWNAWYSGEYVPGYRKVPGVIYARRYRVLEGTSGYSTVYEFASTGGARKPGVEGATAKFLAQFAAHAAGHDACTGVCRGVRTGESLKSTACSRHRGSFRGRGKGGRESTYRRYGWWEADRRLRMRNVEWRH